MDDGFDDMTESEFDEAFEVSLPVPGSGEDEDRAKGFTCNPARISLISFTGSPGITLDGA